MGRLKQDNFRLLKIIHATQLRQSPLYAAYQLVGRRDPTAADNPKSFFGVT
jgi:hypothetical protein